MSVATPRPRSLTAVRRRILAWYDADHRDFPWRGTHDPFAVLVSEVMLQQTQAERVVDRFGRFLARFPTAADLAAAPEAAVLAEWSGLGYNRRALALRAAAREITAAGWPQDVAGLRRLPGVGPYTARAVASLAFGHPVGVVDTNVRRWLLRRFAVADRPVALQALADAMAVTAPTRRSADWTHASMEFGAAVCRARAPRCGACPIARGCPSRGSAATVPVPRQPALAGSDRAYRGAVLRWLASTGGHALSRRTLAGRLRREPRVGPALDTAGWRRILDGLERDRLVHRDGATIRLGGATIGGA